MVLALILSQCENVEEGGVGFDIYIIIYIRIYIYIYII